MSLESSNDFVNTVLRIAVNQKMDTISNDFDSTICTRVSVDFSESNTLNLDLMGSARTLR